jgi:hypothetical protein
MANWQIVLICGILTVAFMLFFSRADSAAPEGTPGTIQLELAFSEDRFSSIVGQWSEAGTLQIQERNLWIDLLFPVAYAIFLSSLLAWLAIRSDAEPSLGFIILLALPFVAGLFDWLENALLLVLLRDPSSFSQPLIFFSSIAASVKWILILVSVLAIVYYIFRKVVGLVR